MSCTNCRMMHRVQIQSPFKILREYSGDWRQAPFLKNSYVYALTYIRDSNTENSSQLGWSGFLYCLIRCHRRRFLLYNQRVFWQGVKSVSRFGPKGCFPPVRGNSVSYYVLSLQMTKLRLSYLTWSHSESKWMNAGWSCDSEQERWEVTSVCWVKL